jgi:hypothetical protein
MIASRGTLFRLQGDGPKQDFGWTTMDYAFAPGTTPQDGRLRRLLTARANTTLISKKGVSTVAGFLKTLVAQSVTADDIVVGSHASDEGFLWIALDPTTAQPINFETLQKVDASKTINIPASIRSATTSLHFKGCTIGSDDSLPFLTLLKSALDNPQSVTAPKYFHSLFEYIGQGVFESMSYSYQIKSKTAYTTTAALIADFVAAGFTEELDGTAVDPAKWTAWIQPTMKLAPANKDKVVFNFPVSIVPPAGGVSAIPDLPAECRSRAEKYTYDLTVSSGPIPADLPGRVALLQTEMASDPMFQASHDYPVYQRMHFTDFNDFFAGFDWACTLNGKTLNFVGTHYVYTLVIPILKPGTTDELIYNYYPKTGTPVMNFLEDNAAFDLFGTV